MTSQRPWVDFQEVKRVVSIEDCLEALGIRDQFTKRGPTLSGICPAKDHLHGPSPNNQQWKGDCEKSEWYCHGDCKRGGDVVELAKAVLGLDNEHIRFFFWESFSDKLSLGKPSGKRSATERAHEETDQSSSPPADSKSTVDMADQSEQIKQPEPLKFYLRLDLEGAMPYLKERGISAVTAERFGAGLCKPGRRRRHFDGYICLPAYRFPKTSDDENPIGYVGRWPGEDFDPDQDRPRYKVGFEASQCVFGLERALGGSDDQPLIVVEGPLTVLYLAENGFPNAVSCLTSSVSEEQAAILSQTGRSIILFFDGDTAGVEGMRRAAARLIIRCFVRVARLPEHKEPDDCSRDELQRLLTFN